MSLKQELQTWSDALVTFDKNDYHRAVELFQVRSPFSLVLDSSRAETRLNPSTTGDGTEFEDLLQHRVDLRDSRSSRSSNRVL